MFITVIQPKPDGPNQRYELIFPKYTYVEERHNGSKEIDGNGNQSGW